MKLGFKEIEEIFQSWRQQIEKNETAVLVWCNLLNDLRAKCESDMTIEQKRLGEYE